MLRWTTLLLCFIFVSCGGGGNAVAPILVAVNVPTFAILNERAGFSAQVKGQPTSFSWDFGPSADPQTSSLPHPIVQFHDEGKFTCSLIVSNDVGESAPVTFVVTVLLVRPEPSPPVITNVSPIAEVGEEGGEVTFLAPALNIPVTWEWDFGGGTSPLVSSNATPVVRLRTEGTYTGQVRATNQYGVGEWKVFEYEVGAPTGVPEKPGIITMSVGNELGAVGSIAQVDVEATHFPSEWHWEFEGGITPSTSEEQHPHLNLVSAGRFEGSVLVRNRFGVDFQRFIYSVGGSEPDRMKQQWGCVWEAERDLIPLTDGATAVLCVSDDFAAGKDLDPGLTTLFPESVFFENELETTRAEILVYEPDGRLRRRLKWPGLPFHPEAVCAGSAGSIVVVMRLLGGVVGQEIDLDPGPGETIHLHDGNSFVALLQIGSDGNLLHWYRDRQFLNQFSAIHEAALLARGPADDFIYVRRISGTSNLAALTLFRDGVEQWTHFQVPFLPQHMAVAGDGAVYLAGRMVKTADFDPRLGGTDFLTPSGQCDVWLTRLESNGDYAWTRQLGGRTAPNPTGGANMDTSGLLALPDNTPLLTGNWSHDVADFDPGPGTDIHFLDAPCSLVSSTRADFMFRLSEAGDSPQVSTWMSRTNQFDGNSLVALSDGGWVMRLVLNPCRDTVAERDLDPGPGVRPFNPANTHALLAFDASGNLRDVSEWNLLFDTASRRRFSIQPSVSDGIYLHISPLLQDIDPGSAILDPEPFTFGELNKSGSVIYLNRNFTWSSPTAP